MYILSDVYVYDSLGIYLKVRLVCLMWHFEVCTPLESLQRISLILKVEPENPEVYHLLAYHIYLRSPFTLQISFGNLYKTWDYTLSNPLENDFCIVFIFNY